MMFDAGNKFNIMIKNIGTEPVRVRAIMPKKKGGRTRKGSVERSHPVPYRVLAVPGPEILRPDESTCLIGYEPGVTHAIEPILRNEKFPIGALDPVPVEFGKPGVLEVAKLKEEDKSGQSGAIC